MSNTSSIKLFIDILTNETFRWILLGLTISITIFAYFQEPIKYSKKKTYMGLSNKINLFVLICITLFLYFFNILGLEFTIPFSKNMPFMWYITLIIIIYSLIIDITINTRVVTNDNENLNPPPSYILPKKYRLIIYYLIIIFDVIIFIQALLYSGINPQFKKTILHQFFLNRFGGFTPKNVLTFIISWLGLIGIFLDAYMINNQHNFSACKYGLPESWDF
jgi:hypothetical protein